VVVPKEVITLLENPSVINVNEAELIDQTGEKILVTITNPKTTKKENVELSLKMMDGNDLDEIENFYEDIEFDDGSEIEYDLDYTTQA
jgi:hypothetical protein